MCHTPPSSGVTLIWQGVVPLGQNSNHAVVKDLISIQQALLRTASGSTGGLPASSARYVPRQNPPDGQSYGTPPKGNAQSNELCTSGQTSAQTCRDHRASINTKQQTTAHEQLPKGTVARHIACALWCGHVSDGAEVYLR